MDTDLAGVNLKRSLEFEPIYLGHEDVAYASGADYILYSSLPNGIQHVIDDDSLVLHFRDKRPVIYYETPEEEDIPLFKSIEYVNDDDFAYHQDLDEIWTENCSYNEDDGGDGCDGGDGGGEDFSAYYNSNVEKITFHDGFVVNDEIPG